PYVAHGFLILFRRAQPLDAWAKATFDVILETRPRRFAVDLDIAGTQLKRAVDQVDGSPRETRRQKRSEVKRSVFLQAPRDHDFRKRLVDRELQVRVRLIVLKFDVVTRLVLLDERCFENQRFDFVVGDDELEIRDLADERVGFSVERTSAKVRAHAAAEVLGLADI